MRVLVAPDKFRGTLAAAAAARAIAAGWRRVRPSDRVEEVPMADGGEGTLDAMLSALGGERRRVRVRGPLGDPVDAAFGLTAERPARAIVEMAAASGLALVSERRRSPLRASTYGTGELIRAACRAGAREVIVGLGGSATTDAGAGMAQALGVRLVDAGGRDIGSGGGSLLDLAGIDVGGLDPVVRRVRFVAACDVEAPLTGPRGAAAVFGPQKGASPGDVEVLDRALAHLAAIVHRDLGLDLRDLPGAGAAGGLGAGLVAFLGAHLRPGVEVVMEAAGLPDRIEAADLVITGEGSFDAQSLLGKVAGGVIRTAREAGVPVVVLCGRAGVEVEAVPVESLVERVGEARALEDTRVALEELAAAVAERASTLSSRG
ncbi:MAG TPA: glycerate kinase [Actinomycetota bacterium]|nr:glycerate kinase [Actinomycetota bacterium]